MLRKAASYTTLALTALLVPAATAPAQAAVWPDHVTTVQGWVNSIKADNNAYGSPASIGYVGTDLNALTKCGSFTALLLKNTYSDITDSVLTALTGSSSPYADEWYNAIDTEAADATSGIGFHKRSTVASLQRGDILASEYTLSGDTGHVMTISSITLTDTGITPPQTIPGVSTVNKYRATVFDSTKSPHGSYASNPYPDSRYKKQLSGGTYIDDQGLGSGTIVVYENPSNGAIVAWAWNVSPTTTSFYYAVTPPSGSTFEYRPMVAGYLDGPGF
jgi:hypothetical protein